MNIQHAVRVAAATVAALAALAGTAQAQPTVVIARIAFKDAATFRYAQIFHQSGDWVIPDVGYIDYGSRDYRELFAGFGRTLVNTKKVTLVGEAYYLHASGRASAGEKYVLPWALLLYRPSARIRGEAVYFPYLPLTQSAIRQHVLERAKLEYTWSRFKAGGGYGAYQRRGSAWQHKPFVTITVSPPRIGDLEVWVERVPGRGAQVQLRYLRVIN